MQNNPKELLKPLLELVQKVGDVLIEIYETYKRDCVLEIRNKSDDSPVTEADWQSHDHIVTTLQKLTPDIPVLSEESAAIPNATRTAWKTYWLVDPLDGTRDFIEMTDEFTINIALIHHNKPILGIIYVPVIKTCYYSVDEKSYKQLKNGETKLIRTNQQLSDMPTIVVSRHHGTGNSKEFLGRLNNYRIIEAGSALKFGLIAEGAADVYPRLGPTSKWDTAAGQCIIEAAGGVLIDLKGDALSYNGGDPLLNPYFLALGSASFPWQSYI